MGKDPAVLLYTSDFLAGVAFFSMEQRGQYITLLCEQHQLGHIPENHMIDVCGSNDSPVFKKFIKDDEGLYYNNRMEVEGIKRAKYCKSRSNNKSGRKKKKSYDKSHDNHMGSHMENGNENRNKDKDRKEVINNIYKNYPNKCPINESSTGKSSKCKNKIEVLLKTHSEGYLIDLQEKYVKDCIKSERYIKNYQTFLNNLPDPESFKNQTKKKPNRPEQVEL